MWCQCGWRRRGRSIGNGSANDIRRDANTGTHLAWGDHGVTSKTSSYLVWFFRLDLITWRAIRITLSSNQLL